MSNMFKTVAAALVDLNMNKLDLITEENKLPAELIDGTIDVDHKVYIKYDLIGVTSSSSVLELNHGDIYRTVLSAAESVKITVGGVDFTDTYYNPLTGEILIEYVSGNINIYASNISLINLYYINKYITGSIYISNRDTEVIAGDAYYTTVVINAGYQLDKIQILMGEEDITGTAWDSGNQSITVPNVTNNIYITIEASLMGYSIMYDLTHATSSIMADKVAYGNPFACTIIPTLGYTLTQCYYSMGGIEYEALDGNIVIDSVTGDLVITAIAEVNTYSVSYSLTHSNITNRVNSVVHNGSIILNYTVDRGYDPENPGITVLGADFSVNTEGRLIMINNVLLHVTITINPNIIIYKISYLLSNCTPTSFDDRQRYYGESFSTVITPSEGYLLEDVTVTMGTDDITEQCTATDALNNIIIDIISVTGDLTITASGIVNTVLVFNMLNSVTTNNMNTIVERHSLYIAALTYDESRFKGLSILVTMGGVDITDTAVSGDNVYIADVTGNIAVIASAISYTYYNLTYNLSGVVLDSLPAQLREDGEYHSGYQVPIINPYVTATITMGDSDVTATAINFETKRIDLPVLTGDVRIVITAVATFQPLPVSALQSMEIDEFKTVLIGNPSITSGYFLGHDGSTPVSSGEGFESLEHVGALAQALSTDNVHKFTVTKKQDTANGEYYVDKVRNFTISGRFNNTNFSEVSFPIDGWKLFQVRNSTLPYSTRTSNINIVFDGIALPQTIYVKAYKSANNANVLVYPLSGGVGVIDTSDNLTIASLDDFYEVTMTSNTLVLHTEALSSGLFANNLGSLYILVPDNIVETEVNTLVTLVGDPYYTIKSANGGFMPSGLTAGGATWVLNNSTSRYTINPVNGAISGIVPNVTAESTFRLVNMNGFNLNASTNIGNLRHDSTTGSGTIWQFYEV